MTGKWLLIDTNGQTVREYPGTPSGWHQAEDDMRPGYGLHWEEEE